MKSILNTTSSIVMIIALMAISCTSSTNTSSEVDKSGLEYTSAFICPMHCEGSGSSEPGTCPVCQMELRPNSNFKANDANTVYACPMHSEIAGKSGDSCSICQMALVPQKAASTDMPEEHSHEAETEHEH